MIDNLLKRLGWIKIYHRKQVMIIETPLTNDSESNDEHGSDLTLLPKSNVFLNTLLNSNPSKKTALICGKRTNQLSKIPVTAVPEQPILKIIIL